MPKPHKGRVLLPTLAALVALLALAPQAGATESEHESPPPGEVPIGLYIKEANADEGKVLAKIRCTGTEHDGTIVGLAVSPEVDMASLQPGTEVGVLIDRSTDPKTIVAVLDDDCPQPETEPKPEPEDPVVCPSTGDGCEDEPKQEDGVEKCSDDDLVRAAHSDGEDRVAPEDGCLPAFVRGFLTRVWKFIGEVDYYESGELSMTIGRLLNVPRKWRTQDDDLLDQDATVLVSNRVRVFEAGDRVSRDRLDAANDVRVHGKLLRPGQWRMDEDGNPVPTIRAKKVYITG